MSNAIVRVYNLSTTPRVWRAVKKDLRPQLGRGIRESLVRQASCVVGDGAGVGR